MLKTLALASIDLLRLVNRLGVSRTRALLSVAGLLAAGVMEASTVGMLVPLLSTLTGQVGDAVDPVSAVLSQQFPGLTTGWRVAVLAGATCLLIALKNVVSYVAVRLATSVRREATVAMRQALLDRLLHATADSLEKRTTGDLANAFLTECARTVVALDYGIQLVQRSILALSYVAAIALISWHLTLLTVMFGVLLGLGGVFLSRRLLRQGGRLVEANAALARRIAETVSGIRVVRTMHTEDQELLAFGGVNWEQATSEVALSRSSFLLTGGIETAAIGSAMGLTAIAYKWLLVTGVLTVSQFFAFGFGLLRLLPAINQIYGVQLALVGLSPTVRQVHEWLSIQQHPIEPFGIRQFDGIKEELELDGVSFSYANGQPGLCNVSLKIPVGTFLAVVGPSGAGKSTLASLLLRHRKPTSGVIRIDGLNHWEFAPESYHRGIAYVEQDPFLFNTTIAENVRYGTAGASSEDVNKALALVRLDTFVQGLPQGLDTVVAERGASLSGGQRQRLTIARALVRSPSLLIFDEPTSSLDQDAEQEVVEAIEQARRGRTAIVIAHRQSTIERADAVLRLDNGRVSALEWRKREQANQ